MERDWWRSCSWKLLKPQERCFNATRSALSDRRREKVEKIRSSHFIIMKHEAKHRDSLARKPPW